MKRLNLIFFIAFSCYLSSCNRTGCTDFKALNYDSKAKKDCCCEYEASVVIWFNEATSLNLSDDFINSLTYYIDGKLIGSSDLSYWNSSPDCGQNGSITYTRNLASYKTQTAELTVFDDFNDLIFESTINLNGGSCESILLSY